uniref:Uncharacterized protein n=1 Tax=Cannabis sativa TaxID=3483 RepID=A0A803NRJ8_CANSA
MGLQKRVDLISSLKLPEMTKGLHTSATKLVINPMVLGKELIPRVRKDLPPFAVELLDQVASSAIKTGANVEVERIKVEAKAKMKKVNANAEEEIEHIKGGVVAYRQRALQEANDNYHQIAQASYRSKGSSQSLGGKTTCQLSADAVDHIAKVRAEVRVEVEAHAEKVHLRSLNLDHSIILRTLWKHDPTILKHLRVDEEEYTLRVEAIESNTYLNIYDIDAIEAHADESGDEHSAEVMEISSRNGVLGLQDPPQDQL